MGTNKQLQKLLLATVFAVLSMVCSTFIVFPNMAPMQHLFNIVGAVILGPLYNFLSALLTGVLRMSITGSGLGSIVGAIFGAALSGVLYKTFHTYFAAFIGEIVGTGIISAYVMYLINNFVLNLNIPHFYYYIPFYLPSSVMGALLGWGLLKILERQHMLDKMKIH